MRDGHVRPHVSVILMMEPMITAATPVAHNTRLCVLGVAGIVLGLGLMVMAVVHARNQPSPPSPWGSTFLLVAGQIIASAGGYAAAIPLIRRRERAARIAAGLCPACGYDLTGNVTGVCPECGRDVAPPAPGPA